MPKIMEKIKKGYNLKILIMIAIVLFYCTNIYCNPIPHNSNLLRVPMGQVDVYSDMVDIMSRNTLDLKSYKTPDRIFQEISADAFPIITTLPSAATHIPEDFTTRIDRTKLDKNLVLVYKNNGCLRVRKTLPISAISRILQKLEMPQDNERVMSLWIKLINNPHLLDEKLDINEYLEEEKDYSFDKIPELQEIIYKGKKYSINEFKTAVPQLFKEQLELWNLIAVNNQYLYRAIDITEWRHIQQKGVFTVLQSTNFEENIDQQVIFYSKSKKYAGIIIRIPVIGPYFMRAGFQVPRITAFAPHFVKPEILISEPDASEQIWVSIEEYLRHQSNSALNSAKNTRTQI